MFYLVLKLLKNSVLKLEKNDKNIQEKLFEIFVFVLVRTLNVENKKFTELTIAIIDDCIEELDKNQKISESLGKYIIEEISNIGIYKSNIQQANVIDIIKLLSRFLEEGKEYIFISRKPENKKLLYKNVYNIGIHSIENNMENAVRSVSKAIGLTFAEENNIIPFRKTDHLTQFRRSIFLRTICHDIFRRKNGRQQ